MVLLLKRQIWMMAQASRKMRLTVVEVVNTCLCLFMGVRGVVWGEKHTSSCQQHKMVWIKWQCQWHKAFSTGEMGGILGNFQIPDFLGLSIKSQSHDTSEICDITWIEESTQKIRYNHKTLSWFSSDFPNSEMCPSLVPEDLKNGVCYIKHESQRTLKPIQTALQPSDSTRGWVDCCGHDH